MATGEGQGSRARFRGLWRSASTRQRLLVIGPIMLAVVVSSIAFLPRSRVGDLNSGFSGFVETNGPANGSERGGPIANSDLHGALAKAKMDALGHAVTLLPQGEIILLAPRAMTVGDEQRVEARVGLNVSFDQIANNVSSTLNVERGTLHISPEMIATLDGAGFKEIGRAHV